VKRDITPLPEPASSVSLFFPEGKAPVVEAIAGATVQRNGNLGQANNQGGALRRRTRQERRPEVSFLGPLKRVSAARSLLGERPG
jgi:hypothetical protein